MAKEKEKKVEEKSTLKDAFSKLNVKNLNSILDTSKRILKILYMLLIFLLIYIGILAIKEFEIFPIILKILGVISPLFIGFIIAWILNPLVKKLTEKGLSRTLSVVLIFIMLIIALYMLTLLLIPAFANQIKDMVSTIPALLTDAKNWIESLFDKISDLSLENLDTTKTEFISGLEKFGTSLQTKLPSTAINVISNIISGVGTILLSFVVGFYMLFNFDKVSTNFIKLFPVRYRDEINELVEKISDVAHGYVRSTLLLSLILSVVSAIGFSIIGLKAPLLIALFCGITNLIPYIGPYMGAALAGLIGFSQSSVIGIVTLLFILIVQVLDGNILNPLIMSKKLDLHPVTILITLLIFGYFFGIIGMIISTPVTALLKILVIHFNKKYKVFDF